MSQVDDLRRLFVVVKGCSVCSIASYDKVTANFTYRDIHIIYGDGKL